MFVGRRAPLAVTVIVLAGCTSSSEVVITPTSPAATAAPAESFTIEHLRIDEPPWKADGANWRLRLSWHEPAGLAVDHYAVTRDGVTVDDEVGSPGFQDDEVEPGARYRYTVVGVDARGGTTQAAVATVRTGEPPLADARLEGSFVVHMRVTHTSGTKDPVRGGEILYTFDPLCGHGACSVRWKVRRSRATGTLGREGAEYTAGLRTPFFVRNCKGRLDDEALDVRLRVKAAAPMARTWRATKIEGSIREVSSHRGCVTASIDWDVSGILQS